MKNNLLASHRSPGLLTWSTMYIDGRPKASGNIAGFINNTRPVKTTKKPNCIFEGREGNRIFVCAIKKIAPGEELLIDYNLNRIDAPMGVNILSLLHFDPKSDGAWISFFKPTKNHKDNFFF